MNEMTGAFELVTYVVQLAMPYVIAFALAGKVVKVLIRAIFKGRLEL